MYEPKKLKRPYAMPADNKQPVILTRPAPRLFPKRKTAWERLLRALSVSSIRRIRRRCDSLRRQLADSREFGKSLQLKCDKLTDEADRISRDNQWESDQQLREIERLTDRVNKLEAENDVFRHYVKTLKFVLEREQERVKAETYRFVKMQNDIDGGESPVGMEVREPIDGA